MSKQYAERDIENQGEHYATHICAMTKEQLLSKSDIAAELAHRDIKIEALKADIQGYEARIETFKAIKAERDRLREALVNCQTYFDMSGCDRQLYDSVNVALNHKEG